MGLGTIAKRTLLNLRGWTTKRKILVVESDDWGSIRMPSKNVYEECLKAGYPVDRIPYERYDSILSQDDLELLFDLLRQFRDIHGNHPIITANCVVANPDFTKIKENHFETYHYELITDTFRKYGNHSNNFKIWQSGIREKVFLPQFHAREHLNVSLFMDALRMGDCDAHFGFNHEMPGCTSSDKSKLGNYYVEATNYNSSFDKEQKLTIYLQGLDLFEVLFGYKSQSITPTSYIWSPDFNKPIFDKGVRILQGIRKMAEPNPEGKTRFHGYYLGYQNALGQVHLVRNVLFEPSLFTLSIKDPVSRCLSDIDIAFKMNKPAVLCSHRINYVGHIDENNRDRNLILLGQILKRTQQLWPDIEYLTSNELGNVILSEGKH